VFHRAPPPRRGALARLWHRLRPPKPEPPSLRTFSLPPPPMATDAHSHPMFLRLAGALDVDQLKRGERVFVVQTIPIGVLRDDAATRARVIAAYDPGTMPAWR
jgi:hypothetical protein